ncbi:YkgJ family cysteine cluster protein [Leminorella grimontii]|uniref:YkgJ family cysteine cluster protein n=1 Tax=Leminorella grimontii TaxID=82981 RepID=UPI0032203269
MECRTKCGACCIAPSISSAIPGMPEGKPSGRPCIHLDDDFRCGIFHHSDRPSVCARLQPCREMCGDSRDEALHYLENLERLTAP